MAATSPVIPPWLRRLYAAPNRLYAARLGWVLGRRVLRLTHVGRRSGARSTPSSRSPATTR